MANAPSSELFLDTSIQIARLVHGPQTKNAIKRRLAQHAKHTTSLVVRQEFKRRLLKEAAYLLGLLHRYKSFDEVHQHVIRLFGNWHQRKRSICLQTLAQIHETTDAERTERLRLYLRSLLVAGLRRFDQTVDEVRGESRCACARHEIIEKVELRRYDLGKDRCSQVKAGTCSIHNFLAERVDLSKTILAHLESIPAEKTSVEIKTAIKFLKVIVANPAKANAADPCLTVGDLLIAMESAGISHFLTLNSAESQHLCRALGQTLIVQPVDPTKPETIYPGDAEEWPEFDMKNG